MKTILVIFFWEICKYRTKKQIHCPYAINPTITCPFNLIFSVNPTKPLKNYFMFIFIFKV